MATRSFEFRRFDIDGLYRRAISTAYKQIELIQATAAKRGLEVVRMTWNPTEFRVYAKDNVTGMLFQGDENRTSDFVTGWIARCESAKG